MMGWEDQLWKELDDMPLLDRIITTGEITSQVSQRLLADLAAYRRQQLVKAIDSGEYTYAALADTIGARTGAVRRLVEEGRRQAREEEILAAAA